jgi:ribonuclease E
VPPHAEPGAEQPELPQVYAGPTPADPFGGHTFDIFDVMERAEDEAAAQPPPVIVAEPEPAQGEAVREVPEPEPAEAVVAFGEPAVAEAVASEPEPPVAEPPVPAPEPTAEPMAANDVAAPEPAVKPIIIGGEQDVIVEKKRGWWRR